MERCYIYGAGKLGIAAADMISRKGIDVLGIIDKKGKSINSIRGFKVIAPEDCKNEEKNSLVLIAISAVPYYSIVESLQELGFSNLKNIGDYLTEIGYNKIANVWLLKKAEADKCIIDTTGFFNDELSSINYIAAVKWFLSRNEQLEKGLVTNWDRDKYFPSFIKEVIRPKDAMIDVSLLTGEYVEKFSELSNKGEIVAFNLIPNSMDSKQYEKFVRDNSNVTINDVELWSKQMKRSIHRIGIMEPFDKEELVKIKTTTLDSYCGLYKCNYLRAYSMSPILPILEGSKKMITNERPIIAINIGHYKNDFVKITNYLKKVCQSYSFYFRMHSFQGNDCIMYCIPKERENKND